MDGGLNNVKAYGSIGDVTSDTGEIIGVIFQLLVMEWDFLCGLPTLFSFVALCVRVEGEGGRGLVSAPVLRK